MTTLETTAAPRTGVKSSPAVYRSAADEGAGNCRGVIVFAQKQQALSSELLLPAANLGRVLCVIRCLHPHGRHSRRWLVG